MLGGVAAEKRKIVEIVVGEGEVTNGKRAEGDKEAVILENAPFLES